MKYSILKCKNQRVELAKLACCFDLFCKMDTDAQATAIMKWLVDSGFRVPNREALKNWLNSENKCEPFYYNVYKIHNHLCCNIWTFILYGPACNCFTEPCCCDESTYDEYVRCTFRHTGACGISDCSFCKK